MDKIFRFNILTYYKKWKDHTCVCDVDSNYYIKIRYNEDVQHGGKHERSDDSGIAGKWSHVTGKIRPLENPVGVLF